MGLLQYCNWPSAIYMDGQHVIMQYCYTILIFIIRTVNINMQCEDVNIVNFPRMNSTCSIPSKLAYGVAIYFPAGIYW
jgi:hypothetical protein